MENNASYIGELSYIVAHAIAINGPEYPDVYRKLAACSEAAILSASEVREDQIEGYQILDELQADAVDDPEMLHTYGRILRFADVATPEELQTLKNNLASFDEPTQEVVIDPKPSKIDRCKEGARKLLDKLMPTETEDLVGPALYDLALFPEAYNQGSKELSLTEVKLLEAARTAKRQMWFSAKVLDFLGLDPISPDESKEWLDKFERRVYWLSAKHLLGYDIGNSELAKRIKNAEPEALKAQFPDMDKRMESVDRFMKGHHPNAKRVVEN